MFSEGPQFRNSYDRSGSQGILGRGRDFEARNKRFRQFLSIQMPKLEQAMGDFKGAEIALKRAQKDAQEFLEDAQIRAREAFIERARKSIARSMRSRSPENARISGLIAHATRSLQPTASPQCVVTNVVQ